MFSDPFARNGLRGFTTLTIDNEVYLIHASPTVCVFTIVYILLLLSHRSVYSLISMVVVSYCDSRQGH